jgi:hypothetical protein
MALPTPREGGGRQARETGASQRPTSYLYWCHRHGFGTQLLFCADTLLHQTNSHAHARAAMICAVLFVNQKGEVIISRHYRDGFDRNIADVFRAQVITSKEV